VIKQWWYDTEHKQLKKQFDKELFICLGNGAIKLERTCPNGIVSSGEGDGENDNCIQGPGTYPKCLFLTAAADILYS
jgi:hypothetical protein